MIRVLHVVSSVRVGSGVMAVIMNYYRKIDRSRIQFDFLYFNDSQIDYKEEIQHLGGYVHQIDKPSIHNLMKRELQQFFAVHSGTWSIIHCHPIYASAFVARAARRFENTKIIQHSHTARYSAHALGSVRNLCLLLASCPYITAYMACSKSAGRLFFWKRPRDIFLLQNTVDVDRFLFSEADRKRIRHYFGIGSSECLIGHVGRFAREKNHFFLLQAFYEVFQQNPKSRLLLVGEGPLREKVYRRAQEMRIADNVLFAGAQSDVEAYYSAMDVFVLPSLHEGFGLAAVEAQLNGLPCILSDAVPYEVAVSPTAVQMPPGSTPAQWGTCILSQSRYERSSLPEDILAQSRGALESQVESLTTFYEGMA